jgi:hypothetical protein
LPSSRKIETTEVLRAIAISLVVFNHAHFRQVGPIGFSGGMAVLLLLSGGNFARFSLLPGAPARAREGALQLARMLAFPTLLIVLLSWPFRGLDPTELFLISNWYEDRGSAAVAVEYSAMVVQMMLAMWAIFWTPIGDSILKRPLIGLLVIYAVSIVSLMFYQRPELLNRLPWQYLWDFALGGILFLVVQAKKDGPSLDGILLVMGLALVAALVAFGVHRMQFYVLTISVFSLLVAPKSLRLPPGLFRIASVVSQASFTIFLVHISLLRLFKALYRQAQWLAHRPVGQPRDQIAFYAAWLFAMGGSIAVWLVWTAARRAYARTKAARGASAAGWVAQPAPQTS